MSENDQTPRTIRGDEVERDRATPTPPRPATLDLDAIRERVSCPSASLAVRIGESEACIRAIVTHDAPALLDLLAERDAEVAGLKSLLASAEQQRARERTLPTETRPGWQRVGVVGVRCPCGVVTDATVWTQVTDRNALIFDLDEADVWAHHMTHDTEEADE